MRQAIEATLAALRLVPPWFDLWNFWRTWPYKMLPDSKWDSEQWERYDGKFFPLDSVLWPLVKHLYNAGTSGFTFPVWPRRRLFVAWTRREFAFGIADVGQRMVHGWSWDRKR